MCHIITGKSQVCFVCIHPVLNICETVRQIVYVKYENQRTEDGALWDTASEIFIAREGTVHNTFLSPKIQIGFKPVVKRISNTIAI